MQHQSTNPAAGDGGARKQSDLGRSKSFHNKRLDNPTQARWRDVLPIHPAAELFPLMSQDELRALGEDIKKNGLRLPVTVWKCPHGRTWLLDGRNRLDALERVLGVPVVARDGDALVWRARHEHLPSDTDPWAYVISANLHRLHLTAKKKRDTIAKLLQADPTKSDRQIAETVKASPTTVGKVRKATVQSGQLKRVGKDGKARKQPKKRRTIEDFQADIRAKQQSEAADLIDERILGQVPEAPTSADAAQVIDKCARKVVDCVTRALNALDDADQRRLIERLEQTLLALKVAAYEGSAVELPGTQREATTAVMEVCP